VTAERAVTATMFGRVIIDGLRATYQASTTNYRHLSVSVSDSLKRCVARSGASHQHTSFSQNDAYRSFKSREGL
jgi:hypothetical protein